MNRAAAWRSTHAERHRRSGFRRSIRPSDRQSDPPASGLFGSLPARRGHFRGRRICRPDFIGGARKRLRSGSAGVQFRAPEFRVARPRALLRPPAGLPGNGGRGCPWKDPRVRFGGTAHSVKYRPVRGHGAVSGGVDEPRRRGQPPARGIRGAGFHGRLRNGRRRRRSAQPVRTAISP